MWFQTLLSTLTPVLLFTTVCCNASLDIPLCSTSLHPDYVLQKVSQAALNKHTFTGSPKTHCDARKQCRRKMSNHGFLLFSNHHLVPKSVAEEDREEWDSIFHDKLPQLLRTRAYKNKFRAIFARVGGHNDKIRFGDHLRLQLKLRTALKIAEARSWYKNASPEKREEFKLVVRARDLLREHYRGLVKVFGFVLDLIKVFAIALCFGLNHICLCVYPDKDHVNTQLCPHEVSACRQQSKMPTYCRSLTQGMASWLKTFI